MGRAQRNTDKPISRRAVLGSAAAVAANSALGCKNNDTTTPEPSPVPEPPDPATLETRTLGKTGLSVEVVSLGGEGILRGDDRWAKAVPMIEEALRLGVRYCDTSPVYGESELYYGKAFANLGKAARDNIILASKTHLRTRDESLALLDASLTRLQTDRLDIWQLHDIRSEAQLDQIFGPGGAIEAVEAAKADGRIKHVGVTGHHRADLLVEAMRRYPFDTVLCAINPSDPAKAPVLSTVVAEARTRNVGIIGMKVMAAGRLLADKVATATDLVRYAASYADTVIIGCSSIEEVRENLGLRAGFKLMKDADRTALEATIAKSGGVYDSYKA